MSRAVLPIRQTGAGGGRGGGMYGVGSSWRLGQGAEDSPGMLQDVPSGYTPYGDRLSTEEQADRRAKSLGRGQLDLAMSSPLIIDAILARQRNRRRGYSQTLLTGGLGVDEEDRQRKTLLGA